MDRFMAAVRRLFGRKEHDTENHNHAKTEEKKEPNEFQKAERKLHPYDEVTLDDEGPTVEASPPNEFQENHNHAKTEEKKEPNEFQKAERKQHPYDEVTLDDEGPTVEASPPNEFQAPKRAPRSYEEVNLPAEGGVEVR